MHNGLNGDISKKTSIDGPVYKELVRKYELYFGKEPPKDPKNYDVLAWLCEDFDVAHMTEGPRTRAL